MLEENNSSKNLMRARDLLLDIYDNIGVEIWLRGKKKSLNGETPIDLIMNDKEVDKVFDIIESMRPGNM